MVTRPATGGLRQHLSTLLAGLDRSRFQPTLFAPPDFTLPTPLDSVPRVPTAIGPTTRPLTDLRVIRHLAPRLRGEFAMVHAHGLRGALIGVLAAQRAGIPAVFTAHNLVPPLGALPRFFLAHVGRHAAAVLAVSQAVAATLLAAGIAPEKIAVIPNGIDLAPFDTGMDRAVARAACGLPAEALLVVAVGRFAPEKGLDVLIRAFPQVTTRFPQARLLLVGSGPLDTELRALADQTPAQNAVVFAGRQSDVAPFFLSADVVAIPSRQEGQGIVALEAMAARQPVVASRVGGLVETILPGETGLLVPSEDLDALAQALLALLADESQRRDMGSQGRARVETEYTAEKMVTRIEAIYSRLA
jgi:glycosyltransferase involved in cell wall biosynthesis